MLSKAQVIALFLASASAQPAATPQTIINSNCSEDTVAAGTASTSLTTCSSNTACSTDADCSTANEVCGSWVQTDVAQADIASFCVHNDACNNLGKIAGAAWTIHCGNADITAADPDTLPVPATLLANVEATVTSDGAGTWADVQNLKVMAWDNFQTGWWIRDEAESTTLNFGIWAETDKPVNNSCDTTADCAESECCANWPDSNNKRCINADLGGVVQTLLPFSSFTPTCVAAPDDDDAPISAEQDLAEEALANAAQEIEAFKELIFESVKEMYGYDEMSDDQKAGFEAAYAEGQAKDDAKEEAIKADAGYDDMTTEQKTIFEAMYLAEGQAIWDICQTSPTDPRCTNGMDVRATIEGARFTDGYYSMTAEERATWDDGIDDLIAPQLAEITAANNEAWITAWAAALVDGQAGFACSRTERCSDSSMCCGTATPPAGAGAGHEVTEGVCADKVTGSLEVGPMKLAYTHQCGAQALLATAATAIAAAYLM